MKHILAAQLSFLAAGAEEETLTGKIFALDAQLILDAAILGCAVLFLFFLVSYFVFDPARELLKKRQERIQKDMDDAAKDKEDALQFKQEYEARLQTADREVDQILSDGKKKAMQREQMIVNEAQEEASRILERTAREVELEKSKVRDEMKQEMILVAREMAGRFITEKMDETKQAQLLDSVISEMGDNTWQE